MDSPCIGTKSNMKYTFTFMDTSKGRYTAYSPKSPNENSIGRICTHTPTVGKNENLTQMKNPNRWTRPIIRSLFR